MEKMELTWLIIWEIRMGDQEMGDGLAFTLHPGTPAGRQKAEAETVLKPAGQVIWTRHGSSSIYEGDSASKG